ncbi:MAG: hypothetical protein EZS28_007521 [Streblomastix strix]|uniref:Uncharacterized protein n=1 Tax=Streblomastix strix TaxID=222440 RepID=A0A5J4WQE2_9EUKA|nr:MAG: hypothetical protein EZS28_007521 [Streblomastix strix]
MKSPPIPEVEPQFDNEIDPIQQPFQQPFLQQIIRCIMPTLAARRRSSIFEETLTPDSSMCRWLLDIISEGEHMNIESAHFVLSENQLNRVVAYTFDVPESQIQLSIENEGCCEDDALLLLKADKSELIDVYSKIEGDEILALKLNIFDLIDAFTKQEVDTLLDNKFNICDKNDAYTKQEDDALLLLKADKSELIDVYSKIEDDELLALKQNIFDQIDANSKIEADALFDDKLNITDQIGAFTTLEADALLILKAYKIELDNYVDLTSSQTIISQKQFGIISVFCISKQNKNDASILFAGGGDILVNSLVSQIQLQEVREIALGKSKKYVFGKTNEMNIWMEDQENFAKLAIGENLYLIYKQVIDYWWNRTGLRALEIELPDMSNVMTILGVATGGGNTIKDLSFVGNTLIPAKMTQDDALLLLKAVKIQLIDAYTQGKADNLFSNKADSGVSYTKGEDDALLLLKADKTQLIDSYTKGEDDALLLLKADKSQQIDVYSKAKADALLHDKLNVSDQIDAYTKGVDGALLLKADKSKFIDVYTKGEADNRLSNKTESGISYTKGEDDALLLSKADKIQLIDAYTKGEADNILNIKADSGVPYTKGEGDALWLLKANQSTTYIKTEIDYLISQIEVGDIDLSDGMSSITGSSFIKSGADDTVELLRAGGTKLISEFMGISTDLSDYYTKIQTYSKTETDNKYVRLDGSIQQTITGRLKYVSPFDYQDETQDPVANTYLTQSKVDSNYVKKDGEVQDIQGILRKMTLDQPYPEPTDDDYITVGTIKSEFVLTIYSGSISGNLTETQLTKSGKNDTSVLLAGGEMCCCSHAAGLSDFPELYAYIKEHYHQPIDELPQPIPIRSQTLKMQVKNNEDIIYGSGDGSKEEFELLVLNALTKLGLSLQSEIQSFLASSGSDPQLIVYDDRITLTASYVTIYLFPNGYLFKTHEDVESHNDEVIINHEIQLGSSPQPQYTISNVYYQVCVFNPYLESKGLQERIQEVGRITDAVVPADGKIQKVKKVIQWANDNVYMPFIKSFAKPILGALGPVGQIIGKDLDVNSSFLDYGYGAERNGQFRQDFACGIYIGMREIEELIVNKTSVPYTIPIRFRVNIQLDDLLKFSAFTDYPNDLSGDLKIKFKIYPHAFVFCQVNPIISTVKYYTMNKDEILGSSQQKLMDIDLMFRNWNLKFQYTKQFTQLGCTADLIT